MSRVSQKSELSPSVTRSSSNIDLGKNDSVDMGRKSEPSITSGGIGVSQEITNIGGLSVRGGVSVDISPINLGVSYDPSENAVSVGAGAEIPGGLLGVSGGVTIDLNTGEITEGSIGGEALGVGVNISASKDGKVGMGISVQIPFTPIEIELGFGYSQKKESTRKPTPEEPTPLPKIPPIPSPNSLPPPALQLTGGNKSCSVIVARDIKRWSTYEGKTEYWSWIPKASVTVDDEGYIRISGDSFNNVYPPWQIISSGISYFSYGGLYGASGEENLVYNEINTNCNFYHKESQVYWEIITVVSYRIIYSDCPLSNNQNPSPSSNFSPSPFPNPPPIRRNMNECCRDSTKMLRAIYQRLGIAKFPGKLPATIIQEIAKEGEQPAEPPQVPINDFVDLLNWQFERDDERWGQWEIQIDIKDGDLTKKGNQGKSVKFPNLAESVAEIEGQMLSIQTNVEALVALSVRNLAEAGMGRQEAIKGYLASMAIAKYMAFPYKEFDVEIPSTYTPGATSIDELVIESIVHTKGIEYEDKETQRDLMLDLLQAAAIIRAVHWRQVDPKKDIKKQILSQLKGQIDLSEKITNVKVAADSETPQKKDSWEDKLDQYENGFAFSTGIEEANTPYGRDRKRRPRIRQIGDNIAQAGKNE